MFSSLRYVAVSVFFALTLLTLIAGIYFKSSMLSSMLELSSNQESKLLTDIYTKTVWNRYYPVIAFLNDKNEKERTVYPQYMAFLEDSKSTTNADNVVKIDIYNPKFETLFESNNLAINEKSGFFSFGGQDKERIALENAMMGQPTSYTMPNTQVTNEGQAQSLYILKSYIPLSVTKIKDGTEDLAAKAKGVMVINYDITAAVKKIETIQFILVFLIILALAILTAAVFVSSQRAETIIEKQQEVSLEMLSAKSAAEAESKAKSQFLANVSHELRTPLNAIIGFSEIISSETMGPINNDQYKDFIKDIHTSGIHLLGLINDILDFSKAEENKLQVDFEQVDITKLAKMSIRMILPRAEQAKVELVENIPTEHIVAIADNKRLKQVILNLLSNAVKFTPENGKVGLKLWKVTDNNTICLEVNDTGVGMAAQDLAQALAPFGQVDNKLSRRYDGTGLGLPLTKKLVELMKGKFDIKSEVGLGTTVTITLPLPSNAIESDEMQSSGTKPVPLVPPIAH
jgi:two-component system cell cycle sensor histidine kinase PleC